MIFAAQILSLRLDTTDNLCIAQLCFELIECKGLFTKKPVMIATILLNIMLDLENEVRNCNLPPKLKEIHLQALSFHCLLMKPTVKSQINQIVP